MKFQKKHLLILVVVGPGVLGVLVFGKTALQDWAQLKIAASEYKKAATVSSDLAELFKLNTVQTTQRINLFADGTWTLLSAILAAIGFHGLWGGK